MPDETESPERQAIEAAYADHVATLFRVLVTNLGDAPVTHQTDQQLLERFRKGLETARRARQLALTIV